MLDELRQSLRSSEIAEVTGLRPETISRIRPGHRPARRTERLLDDLCAIVTALGGEPGGADARIRFALVRRRPELDGRSIADLLRAGLADRALELLAGPADDSELAVGETLERELAASERGAGAPRDRRTVAVRQFLAADPQVSALLEKLPESLQAAFRAPVRLEPTVLPDESGLGDDELFVGVASDLELSEANQRLGEFLGSAWDRLGPATERIYLGVA